MQAADERGTLRRAGMARVDSLWRQRVRYRTADVRRRLVLAQALEDNRMQQVVLRAGQVIHFSSSCRGRPATPGCLAEKRRSAPIPAGCSDDQQAPLAGEAALRFGAALAPSISDFSPSRPP